MISILSASFARHHLEELREVFELEWVHIDPFEGSHSGFAVPDPLLAVDDQDALVGGLSFTSFAKPKKKELGVWVNALIVAPEYRGMGTASKLIGAAEIDGANTVLVKALPNGKVQHEGFPADA